MSYNERYMRSMFKDIVSTFRIVCRRYLDRQITEEDYIDASKEYHDIFLYHAEVIATNTYAESDISKYEDALIYIMNYTENVATQ